MKDKKGRVVFSGNIIDRLGRAIPTLRRIFHFSEIKHSHEREDSRRRRQIERGMLRVN